MTSEGFCSAVEYDDCTDSGYASRLNSEQDCAGKLSFTVDIRSGNPLLRRKRNLKAYEQHISEAIQARFRDLKELFGRPLYQYLRKRKVNFGSIVFRLKVLGEDEASAKPWILVFCDKDCRKQVQQYFKQPLIKDECLSRSTDLPSLEVVVSDQPLKLLAMLQESYDIYASQISQPQLENTLCGTAIKADVSGETRFATIGGLVKIVGAEGDLHFYAMTAGHLVRSPQTSSLAGSDSTGVADFLDSDDDETDGLSISSTEDFEEDDTVVLAVDSLGRKSRGQESLAEPEEEEDHSRLHSKWNYLGYSLEIPLSDASSIQRNLDYALINVSESIGLQPNLAPGSAATTPQHLHADSVEEPVTKQPRSAFRDEVCLLSARGALEGSLNAVPSFVLLSPGQELVKMYTLSLNSTLGLKSGDSDSWVIGRSTGRLYGHVVAADVFGEAYVVPITDTFDDIKAKLACTSVGLPLKDDIEARSMVPLRSSISDKLFRSDIGETRINEHGETTILVQSEKGLGEMTKEEEVEIPAPQTATDESAERDGSATEERIRDEESASSLNVNRDTKATEATNATVEVKIREDAKKNLVKTAEVDAEKKLKDAPEAVASDKKGVEQAVAKGTDVVISLQEKRPLLLPSNADNNENSSMLAEKGASLHQTECLRPLSSAIIASIIDLAAKGSRVSFFLNEISYEVANASLEMHAMSRNLSLCSLILKQVGTVLQAPDSVHSYIAVEGAKQIAADYKLILDEIEGMLVRFCSYRKDRSLAPYLREELMREFKKRRVTYLMGQLESLRLSLALMLQILQLGKLMAATSKTDSKDQVVANMSAIQQQRFETQSIVISRYWQIHQVEKLYEEAKIEAEKELIRNNLKDELPRLSVDAQPESKFVKLPLQSSDELNQALHQIKESPLEMMCVSGEVIDPLLNWWSHWNEIRERRHAWSYGLRQHVISPGSSSLRSQSFGSAGSRLPAAQHRRSSVGNPTLEEKVAPYLLRPTTSTPAPYAPQSPSPLGERIPYPKMNQAHARYIAPPSRMSVSVPSAFPGRPGTRDVKLRHSPRFVIPQPDVGQTTQEKVVAPKEPKKKLPDDDLQTLLGGSALARHVEELEYLEL